MKCYKILHILPRIRKGGAERLCLDICNQLQKSEGVQVRLITFSAENEYPLLTKNLDWHVIPASVQLSVFHKNRYHVDALQKAIEDFAPDVIHTHLFEAEIVSRSCYYPQARWFSHCHDNMKQFRNFGLKTLCNKELLTNQYEKHYMMQRYRCNGGNTFIAISKNTEEYFKASVQELQVVLMHNAIDYTKFNAQVANCTSGVLRLVNVGSYTPNKNQAFLVDVVRVLQSRNVNVELHLLGDGEKFKEVQTYIANYELEHSVFQHGAVDEVETYLWKSSIYVHAAYSEAFGLTLLEAMATGLPVVTLDGKGNRDLIKDGKNGYMLYEQNTEVFADRILEIWNDKQKYQQMSKFAQEYAKQYDIKPYVDRLLELYKS